jgi:hypothetical protein
MFFHKTSLIGGASSAGPIGTAALAGAPTKFSTGSLSVAQPSGGPGGVNYTVPSRTWGDFTMECWVYPVYNSNGAKTIMQFGNLSFRANFVNAGQCETYFTETGGTVKGGDIPYNAWSWIALVGTGSQYRFYVNGDQDIGSLPDPEYVPNQELNVATRTTPTIGCLRDLSNGFSGYIDEARISTVARYTNAFFVSTPGAAFTLDASTYVLCSYDGTFDNEVVF